MTPHTLSTSLPEPVLEGIAGAVASIGVCGEFPAIERGAVHRLLDDAAADRYPEAGRYVRAKLALVCAYATLPIARDLPELAAEAEGVVDLAVATMHGDGDPDVLEARTEQLTDQVDDLLGAPGCDPRAVYALLACAAAVGTLLYDTTPEEIAADPLETDPADWDASFLSSLAITGGASWECLDGADERRRFWAWYLEEALPYAWDAQQVLEPRPAVAGLAIDGVRGGTIAP